MVLRFRRRSIGEEKTIKGFAYLPKAFRVRGETIIIWWKSYEVTKRWVAFGQYKMWIDVDLKIK